MLKSPLIPGLSRGLHSYSRMAGYGTHLEHMATTWRTLGSALQLIALLAMCCTDCSYSTMFSGTCWRSSHCIFRRRMEGWGGWEGRSNALAWRCVRFWPACTTGLNLWKMSSKPSYHISKPWQVYPPSSSWPIHLTTPLKKMMIPSEIGTWRSQLKPCQPFWMWALLPGRSTDHWHFVLEFVFKPVFLGS